MNEFELSERFAYMWRSSRENAGKSQEYMAKSLGVSKKTVQNWEAGTSCPNQQKGFEWFLVLGVQPLPYYLKLLYPGKLMDINVENESEIEEAIFRIIKDMRSKQKLELLYLLSGNHGSSPTCILEMMTAYLQTPLEFRLNVASGIAVNYEVTEARGQLKNPDRIQPDMDMLRMAISRGREAVIAGKDNYTYIL